MESRFVPMKRTALDGRVWWCVWDCLRGQYSTFLYHGKYKRKKDAQFAIDYYNLEVYAK